MPLVAGIDIGGGSAKLGIVDPRGTIVVRDEMPTPAASTSDELAEAYACGIGRLLEAPEAGNTIGIGVGVPGHLDESGLTSTFSNVPLLDNYPLAAFLERRFQVPVRIDNDATLAALAEHRFGAGRKAKRLLVVTLGTGIGLGLVVDGEPQRPVRGCMGDPGHIIVDPEARWTCRQGCRGCLESLASSLALERDAAAMASLQPDSRLGTILAREGRLRTAEVITAARDGDDAAVTLLEKLGAWLGMAAASWCALYDPDLILFGGGVRSTGRLLVSSIRRTMKTVGMPEYVAGNNVGLVKLGNDAGLIGAASLFADCLED
jgi:glucokinase